MQILELCLCWRWFSVDSA